MQSKQQNFSGWAILVAVSSLFGCGERLMNETSELAGSGAVSHVTPDQDTCSASNTGNIPRYARTELPDFRALQSTVKAKDASYYDQNSPNFWSVHANLATALELYQATGNRNIATVLTTEARSLYVNKGTSRNIKDYSKRAKIAGWPVKRHNKDAHLSYYLIDQANVLVPILGFFLEPDVNENSKYDNLKGKWVTIAKQIFESFKTDLKDDDGSDAYYVWPSKIDKIAIHRDYTPGAPLPYNMTLRMGHAALLLSELSTGTQKKKYRDLAKAIGRKFKAGLTYLDDSDSYTWNYRMDEEGSEDMMHGGIGVQFAVSMYEKGLVFKRIDINRFANTLVGAKRQKQRGGDTFTFLNTWTDRTNQKEGQRCHKHYAKGCGRWLPLAKYDRRVLTICKQVYESSKHHRNKEFAARLWRAIESR